ncbi:glycosyltransferase involved in cell wall biosynthesis [Ulvibacter sp. MAR_2010_11]|uniref:glycosyltransferase family 2 protein n=1 Tax=Ulvibacter sp. MAR_2010_11 TaxID=1250229 RepID=UPI000C2BF688|nr:glycosyltransferase family 2 protein [Ulvibacter sp. MAR_2010_11]PKA82119.1 glycosyltransferase involved in cell wall biosynthesis [Ulvibacter sp. MAR_2010_11]
METPLVSVIIPTYNRPAYLKEALDSVVDQTFTNFEILVVDDGSNVNYAEDICKNYLKCTYLYKPNGGLSSARNFGVRNAKGSLIAFLDDDDFWRTDKLEKQVKVLQQNKAVNLVHAAAAVVDIKSNPTGKIIGASKEKATNRSGKVFWNALGTWVVKSPTPLIRKEVFTPDLYFDESLKVGEDVDFYQRLFYRHKIEYIDEPLAFYRDFGADNRLSTQRKKYIGIEQKMIDNFKKMGIYNPLVLYKIRVRLLKQAIRNWNLAYPDNSIKINTFNLYLRPGYYLKHCFKPDLCE